MEVAGEVHGTVPVHADSPSLPSPSSEQGAEEPDA